MTRQRRSRYTVTLEGHDKPEVILGYGEASAIETAEHHFKRKVTSIVGGDYRRDARRAEAKTRNPPWDFDVDAIYDAMVFLGIVYEVEILKHEHVGMNGGKHRFKPSKLDPLRGEPYHYITMKSYLSVEYATLVLWHELTHAVQAERAGSVGAWRDFCKEQDRWPYKTRPIELEANRVAEENKHKLLVVLK